ncbi:hypothetical protein FB446DRAFT_792202 [Lentinula raphanica]|nr:hypothetical protein FB446DRAFT_792202 [Lentinula raphanica]
MEELTWSSIHALMNMHQNTVTDSTSTLPPQGTNVEYSIGNDIDALNSLNWQTQSMPRPTTASIHLALASSVHDRPRDFAEFYHIDLDAFDSLVEVQGVYTLDVLSALSLVRNRLVPKFQPSLQRAGTCVGTAMEPPISERPFCTLANFSEIGNIGSLDESYHDGISRSLIASVSKQLCALDTNEPRVIGKYLSDRSRAPFSPMHPSTCHFVLLLIDPEISSTHVSVPSPAFHVEPQMIASVTARPATPTSTISPSPTPPSLSNPTTSNSTSQITPHALPTPQSTSTPASPTLANALPTVDIIVARDFNDACRKVHGFNVVRYKLPEMSLSKTVVMIVCEWRFTYDILIRLGYNKRQSLASQTYRWSTGVEETFEEIITQIGWTEKDFKRKCRTYLWAEWATATQTWHPHYIPNENSNDTELYVAYLTWRRMVLLWKHTEFLSSGTVPSQDSSDSIEADIAKLRQNHIGDDRSIIERFLVPLSE